MTHTVIPQTVLTVPLRPVHRITLHFLLPPLIHLIVFTFELAISIAFCWCLITRARIPLLMGITIFLIFLPAVVTAVTILIRGSKENGLAKKVAITILASLAFPVWTIYRLTVRTFWAIDALLILHHQGNVSGGEDAGETNAVHKWGPRGEEVEEALNYSIEPSSAELYLFLRAFLFSFPNAFINAAIILIGLYDVDFAYETYRLEAASIIFSLVYLSMTAAYYQHFESQHLAGRDFPWRGKPKRMKTMKEVAHEEKPQGGEEEEQKGKTTADETVDETGASDKDPLSKTTEESSQTDDEKMEEKDESSKMSQAPKSSPPSSPSSPNVILRHPPVLPEAAADGTYRGFYIPVPNEMAPPPPRTRPPRIPGGFRDIFCDSVSTTVTSVGMSGDHSVRGTLFGWPSTFKPFRHSVRSTREPTLPHTPVQGVFPALPTRVITKKMPKLYSMEHDDAIGLCVSFSHWFLLLIARAVSLGTAFNYFPKPTAGLCAAHILIVAIWLLRREGPPYFVPRKLVLRFGLAVISVSGVFIELGGLPFGPKVPIFHEMLLFAEDLALGLGWILSGLDDSWWHSYTFYMCIGGHLLSMSCALMYLFALRPRKHLISEDNKEEMPLPDY